MAITNTWGVRTLLRDGNDKVTAVIYTCKAKEGTKESFTDGTIEIDGDVTVPFADITKDLATTWAKNALGDKVSEIESLLAKDITDLVGVPWTS